MDPTFKEKKFLITVTNQHLHIYIVMAKMHVISIT